MRTIRLEQPGRLVLVDTPEPGAPGPGEALVRVCRVGICGTDLHAFRGRQPFFSYPRVLGHELGVEVLTVGPGVAALQAGDRCAVEPYLHCGRCIACRAGKTNCCADLKVLGVHIDGGMRERIVVPAAKLHRSRALTLDQLALVETLGIGAHAVARGQPAAGQGVLVVGAGPIGLTVVQFAIEAGARVVAMDTNADRLDSCRRHLNPHATVQAGEAALDEVRQHHGGDLPTLVFDATGNAQSMMSAFRFVAPGGRLVFVGLFQGDVTFHDPDFHRRELTLLASRNSTAADFRRIIGLVEAGRIDTTPWITHRARAEDLPAAFPTWLDPQTKCLKALAEFA